MIIRTGISVVIPGDICGVVSSSIATKIIPHDFLPQGTPEKTVGYSKSFIWVQGECTN
jgi:hypothetical protein